MIVSVGAAYAQLRTAYAALLSGICISAQTKKLDFQQLLLQLPAKAKKLLKIFLQHLLDNLC